MKLTSSALCLAFAAWGANSGVDAAPIAVATSASAPSNAASGAASGPQFAQAGCPAHAASASLSNKRTSKARHTIMDGDPCADPHSAPGER